MITQKSLHLKIDENLLVQLDDVVRQTGINRNKFINDAIRLILDARRSKSMYDYFNNYVYKYWTYFF